MNKKFIAEFISEKKVSGKSNSLKIQEMINLFPYCETLRKIDLCIKQKNEDVTFEESLPKVAVYSSNRKSLFLLLLNHSNSILFKNTSTKNKINTAKKPFHDWLQNSLTQNKKRENIIKNQEITITKNENTDDLMTETLAKLYLEQGHFEQAIRAYHILRLKYPKKSSLFASEIKKINKLKLKNER